MGERNWFRKTEEKPENTNEYGRVRLWCPIHKILKDRGTQTAAPTKVDRRTQTQAPQKEEKRTQTQTPQKDDKQTQTDGFRPLRLLITPKREATTQTSEEESGGERPQDDAKEKDSSKEEAWGEDAEEGESRSAGEHEEEQGRTDHDDQACWNCGGPHLYPTCQQARRRFCYTCGQPGVTRNSCRRCGRAYRVERTRYRRETEELVEYWGDPRE